MKPFLNRRPLLLFLAVAALIGLVALCRGLAQDKGLPPRLPAPGAAAPDPATGKAPTQAASDLIRWHRDIPGDSAPIILDADQITIWIVGDSQYVLMRGKVLVQQALVQVRCGQAIAWLDRKYYKERKIWHLVLYAEDQVSLDCTTAIKSGTRGLVDLHSRGELKLQSHVNKLEQKNLSSEPLVHRGLEVYRETTDLEPERANHAIRQAGSVQRIPEPAVYVPPVAPVAPTPLAPVTPITPVTPLPPQPTPIRPVAPAGAVIPPAGMGQPQPANPTPVAPVPLPPVPLPPLPSTPGSSSESGAWGGSSLPAVPTPAGQVLPAPVPPASVRPLPPGQPQTMRGEPVTPWATANAAASAGAGRTVVYRAAMPDQDQDTLVHSAPPGSGGGVSLIPTTIPQLAQPVQPVQASTPSSPGPTIQGVVPPGGGPPGIPIVPPIPPPSKVGRPQPAVPAAPATGPPQRNYIMTPRSGNFQIKTERLPSGEMAVVVTGGGVILSVRGDPKTGLVDIEADRLVIFTHSQDPGAVIGNMQKPQVGLDSGPNGNKDLEFYLSGNVEIRQADKQGQQTMRAAEVYYDVPRNVAVALSATLEITPATPAPGTPGSFLINDPVIVRADEILRTSATTFDMVHATIFSSKLPSDPGLKVYMTTANIEDRQVPKTNIFGKEVKDRKTGETLQVRQDILTAHDVFFDLEDVPFFYLPYLKDDLRDPLGPIQTASVGYSRIFGFSTGVSIDPYNLLGIQKVQGTRWRIDLSELTNRGPLFGTRFDYSEHDMFDFPNNTAGQVRAMMIYDTGRDNLGGNRLTNQYGTPPAFESDNTRGRFYWRQNAQDLPEDVTVQSQVYYLSDRNYLEQYYKTDFDSDISPQTFLYTKQQRNNWAWTVDTEAHDRSWVNESIWLPKADGYLIGQSFFDVFTYSAHASLGYDQLRISTDPEPQVSPTDVATNTGRANLMQDLSYPFSLGAFRIVPYGQLQTTEYSSDIQGSTIGRVWGAVGTRATTSVSQVFPDVSSELLNVNGINHKITFGINAFASQTNVHYNQLPQLDRLNDDATDMALRDLRPDFQGLYPSVAPTLLGPITQPQNYAIQQLLMTSTETLDDLRVIQGSINNRWQTKRGYPGFEHIIDWMTLDLSASFFPEKNSENYGSYWAFLAYNWNWNIGDRTALFSNGWYDPYTNGPDYFLIGANFNRGDRTNFSLTFREIDPIQSRSVTGTVTYIFSPKYALSASISYDFGSVPVITESCVLTRIGTDVQVSAGLSYNNLQNTVGFQFEIIPNMAVNSVRNSISGLGQPGGLNSASPSFYNQ